MCPVDIFSWRSLLNPTTKTCFQIRSCLSNMIIFSVLKNGDASLCQTLSWTVLSNEIEAGLPNRITILVNVSCVFFLLVLCQYWLLYFNMDWHRSIEWKFLGKILTLKYVQGAIPSKPLKCNVTDTRTNHDKKHNHEEHRIFFSCSLQMPFIQFTFLFFTLNFLIKHKMSHRNQKSLTMTGTNWLGLN